MKIQKIGIVGSGNIGGTLGVLLARAGYEVLFSSRHPDTLRNVVAAAGGRACAGTVAEAVAFGEVIVLSLPLKAMPGLDAGVKEALKGKIVIDTSNPYPERDGAVADEARKEPGGMGVFVARLFPGARIVRAFNSVYFEDLKRTKNRAGERIGIPIAGDDTEGVAVAVELTERAGLDPVVVGGLSSSKLFDVGTAVYATSASAREIREKLRLAPGAAKRAAQLDLLYFNKRKRLKEVCMTYTIGDLKNKVLEMYPDIEKHKVGVDMTFDDRKNAYILAFSRGKDVLTTHLEKHDADECMDGIKCVYLGVQVAQFIRNFEERVVFGRQAA